MLNTTLSAASSDGDPSPAGLGSLAQYSVKKDRSYSSELAKKRAAAIDQDVLFEKEYYGGDFSRQSGYADNNFVMDGLVCSDRQSVHPAYYEFQ